MLLHPQYQLYGGALFALNTMTKKIKKTGPGRWTHELCTADVVINANGKELFCSHCSV